MQASEDIYVSSLPFSMVDCYGQVIMSGRTGLLPVRMGYETLNEEAPPGHYWQDGWIAMPPKPSEFHEFHWPTHTWQDARTLESARKTQWEQIKKQRALIEFGPFTYNGKVFDGNANAQRRMGSYISVSKGALASGTAFEAEFILANNESVVLTAEDFVALELAKVNQVAAAFATAYQLRLQIDAAHTIEDVLAIVWPE